MARIPDTGAIGLKDLIIIIMKFVKLSWPTIIKLIAAIIDIIPIAFIIPGNFDLPEIVNNNTPISNLIKIAATYSNCDPMLFSNQAKIKAGLISRSNPDMIINNPNIFIVETIIKILFTFS